MLLLCPVCLDGVVLGCVIAGGALGLVVAHGAYFGRKIAEFAAASAKWLL
jgi:predicted transporter